MTNLPELLAQRQALEASIAEAQATVLGDTITQIRKMIADIGLTPEQMVAHLLPAKKRRGGGRKSVGAAKFRHKPTGATWTGKGRKPNWFAEGSPDVEDLSLGI